MIIVLLYLGIIILVYGFYNIISYKAYFPVTKASKNIYFLGHRHKILFFWNIILLQLSYFIVKKFNINSFEESNIKTVLWVNGINSKIDVWIICKILYFIMLFILCIPLLYVSNKVFLYALIICTIYILSEIFIYYLKYFKYKKLFENEIELLSLLGYKYFVNSNNIKEFITLISNFSKEYLWINTFEPLLENDEDINKNINVLIKKVNNHKFSLAMKGLFQENISDYYNELYKSTLNKNYNKNEKRFKLICIITELVCMALIFCLFLSILKLVNIIWVQI